MKETITLTAREYFTMDTADLPSQISERKNIDNMIIEKILVQRAFLSLMPQELAEYSLSALDNIIITINPTYVVVSQKDKIVKI